jgi:hypothetical protein
VSLAIDCSLGPLRNQSWVRTFPLSRHLRELFRRHDRSETGLQRLFDEAASHLRFLQLVPGLNQRWGLRLYQGFDSEPGFCAHLAGALVQGVITSVLNLSDLPARLEIQGGPKSPSHFQAAAGAGIALHLLRDAATWRRVKQPGVPYALLCSHLLST